MKQEKIKNLKKGEFIKRAIKGQPSQEVYIKGDYDRASKSYSCVAYFDVNKEIFIKADKVVFYDFEF